MYRKIDGYMGRQINRQRVTKIDGCIERQMDVQKDRWMYRKIDGCIGRQINRQKDR